MALADPDLKKLLEICVDPKNEHHEQGWYEFDRRYRTLMLGAAHKIISNHDDVEEIIGRVMLRLITNNFKGLRNFRSPESEPAFRVYLSVIVKRTALVYINEIKIKKTEQLNPDHPDKNIENEREDVYNENVSLLRTNLSKTQKKKHTQERDILIFSMRQYGFKSKQVSPVPLLDTSAHNVDIVVNRLRKLINRNK